MFSTRRPDGPVSNLFCRRVHDYINRRLSMSRNYNPALSAVERILSFERHRRIRSNSPGHSWCTRSRARPS